MMKYKFGIFKHFNYSNSYYYIYIIIDNYTVINYNFN